jgi:hypothetical protein
MCLCTVLAHSSVFRASSLINYKLKGKKEGKNPNSKVATKLE